MLIRLRSINPPCVPFPGTYLTQIFFFKTDKSTYVQPNNEEFNSTDVSFLNVELKNLRVLKYFSKKPKNVYIF